MNASTAAAASASSAAIHWTTRSSPDRPATCAWKAAVSVLNDFV